MTQEEKAKRYDKIIEKANKMHHENCKACQMCIEELILELKESEDERIRKEIIEYIKIGTYHKDWIAWLEKQDKIDKASYEIAEKEKREFVGDGFIKCYANFQDFKEGETYWLEYVGNDNYNVRSDNLLGKMYHITPCQLYTIFKKQTWLEKQRQKLADKVEPIEWSGKINSRNAKGVLKEMLDKKLKSNDKVEPKFKVGDWITDGNITIQIEAIKNDCYLYCGDCVLYSTKTADKVYHIWTIQDAKDGDVLYECNEKKPFIFKELETKHIGDIASYCDIFNGIFNPNEDDWTTLDIVPATKEQRDTLMKAMTDAGYTFDFEKKELKKIEQESTWNEKIKGLNELETYILSLVPNRSLDAIKVDTKNIRYIINKEQKYALNKEDEYIIKDICNAFEKGSSQYIWLKSLKDRVLTQPRQKWSEEDDEILDSIIEEVRYIGDFPDYPTKEENELYDECLAKVEWLKSLKERYTWKPSDEQIGVIEAVINNRSFQRRHLDSLYEQLKKLKEE